MMTRKVEEHVMGWQRRVWSVLQGVILCTIGLFFLGFILRALRVPGGWALLLLGAIAAAIAIILIFFHQVLALAANAFGWVKFPLWVRIAHCIGISTVIAGMVYVFYLVATTGLKR